MFYSVVIRLSFCGHSIVSSFGLEQHETLNIKRLPSIATKLFAVSNLKRGTRNAEQLVETFVDFLFVEFHEFIGVDRVPNQDYMIIFVQ